MKDVINEKLLLYKVRIKRDPEAYGLLYDLYVKKIYRFIFFKISSREEAEDLTSEVFLKAWNYLVENSEQEIRSFASFIYRIARNLVVDFYRERAKRLPESSLDAVVETLAVEEAGGEHRLMISGEVEKIMKTLKKMKLEYQEAVLLHYIEELSAGEVARILGKSQINVRVTLHRALKKLKELLEKNRIE
ncbi:MAG: RNA polymerase sigma factor [Candidatus Magasanikbacteria bacterium]|nr:RNA polymerase sigma factor [Candidatus Magasanikbacteria bacterium]